MAMGACASAVSYLCISDRRLGDSFTRNWTVWFGSTPPALFFGASFWGGKLSCSIFEADLQPEPYAYRRDRSALDAVRHVHKLINTGHEKLSRQIQVATLIRFRTPSSLSRWLAGSSTEQCFT
jgi:hypothetical protein